MAMAFGLVSSRWARELGHSRLQSRRILPALSTRSNSSSSSSSGDEVKNSNPESTCMEEQHSSNWRPHEPTYRGVLERWMSKRGIRVHPHVRLEFGADGASRVMVTAAIPKDEAVIRVPGAAVFCASNVYQQSALAKQLVHDALIGYDALRKPERAEREPFGLVELSVLAWLQHVAPSALGDSKDGDLWGPWLRFWPTQLPTGLLLSFEEVKDMVREESWVLRDEKNNYFYQPEAAQERMKQLLSQQHKFFQVVSDNLELDFQPVLDIIEERQVVRGEEANSSNFPDQLRDFYSVMSHKFIDCQHPDLLAALKNDAPNHTTAVSGWDIAVVPCVDFVQHQAADMANSKLAVTASSGSESVNGRELPDVSLLTTRDLVAGELVFRDYGMRTNESAVVKRSLFDPTLPMGPSARCNWGSPGCSFPGQITDASALVVQHQGR